MDPSQGETDIVISTHGSADRPPSPDEVNFADSYSFSANQGREHRICLAHDPEKVGPPPARSPVMVCPFGLTLRRAKAGRKDHAPAKT